MARTKRPRSLPRRDDVLLRALLTSAVCLLALLGGCTRMRPPSSPVHIAHTTTTLRLEGIVSCDAQQSEAVTVDPMRPMAVLVHGCHATREDFALLADVLSIHEQQTVCFRYDDRERVSTSAARLRTALEALSQQLVSRDVMVLGHSQGGLVARAAVASPADEPMKLPKGRYRLVTISTPFGGVKAAGPCGSVPYHLASFGVTVAVCRGISGAKWNEIHPHARMVQRPNALDPAISEHLAILTDERESCRRYSPDGRHCLQDDFVFSLAEQHNPQMERDPRMVKTTPISAGHVEVVGARHEPRKLLEALQEHGMMRATSPEQRIVVERMIAKQGW